MLTTLSRAALVLAGVHVAVGAGMGVIGNPDGWLGGALYAFAYAFPMVLIALAIRAASRSWQKAGAWAAIILAVYDTLVVVGNWSGYSGAQTVFVVSITVPTVILYALVFWAVVLRRPAAAAPLRHTPS